MQGDIRLHPLKPGGDVTKHLSQSFNQYEVMDSVLRSSRSSLLAGNKPEVATAEKTGEVKAEVEEEGEAVAEKGVWGNGGEEHNLKMLVIKMLVACVEFLSVLGITLLEADSLVQH